MKHSGLYAIKIDCTILKQIFSVYTCGTGHDNKIGNEVLQIPAQNIPEPH